MRNLEFAQVLINNGPDLSYLERQTISKCLKRQVFVLGDDEDTSPIQQLTSIVEAVFFFLLQNHWADTFKLLDLFKLNTPDIDRAAARVPQE